MYLKNLGLADLNENLFRSPIIVAVKASALANWARIQGCTRDKCPLNVFCTKYIEYTAFI